MKKTPRVLDHDFVNEETPETRAEEDAREALYQKLVDFLGNEGYELESIEDTARVLNWMLNGDDSAELTDLEAAVKSIVGDSEREMLADYLMDQAAQYETVAVQRDQDAREFPADDPVHYYNKGKAHTYSSLASVNRDIARDLRADMAAAKTDG